MSDESSGNLYVSGLADSVTEDVLRSAFISFGELADVHVPIDPKTGLSKGFGFVLFEFEDDALSATDNMDKNVIHGQRIRVRKAARRGGGATGKAIWHAAEEGAVDPHM
jgi:RNA recognition motif-containing protein